MTLPGRRRAEIHASIRRESSPWRNAHSRLSGSSGPSPSNLAAARASQSCFALIAGGAGGPSGYAWGNGGVGMQVCQGPELAGGGVRRKERNEVMEYGGTMGGS